MIQSPIAEQEDDKKVQQQMFHTFNSRIKNAVSKLGGHCVCESPCSSQFHFRLQNTAISKCGSFIFSLKCTFNNNLFAICIEMTLKQYWEEVVQFGLKKLLFSLNRLNLSNQQVYQFNQSLKLIAVKIYETTPCTSIQIDAHIDKGVNSLFQFVYPILNPSKYKHKQGKKKLQYLADMLEILRRRQDKASRITNIKRLSLGKIKQASLTYQTSQNIQKFQNLVLKYRQSLFQRYMNEPKILRCIKQIEENKDFSWSDEQLGAHSFVQKTLLKYQINEQSSINSQTNEQIEKAKKISSSQQEKQQKQLNIPKNKKSLQQVQKTSWLIKKKPNAQGRKSFEVQKQALIFLRGQKCSSINSYYTREISATDKIEYLYSDFHQHQLFDQQYNNARSYLKVFETFCQGLVFLRENAISHRDLKPENILLSKNLKAKIIDFGSACHNRLFANDPDRPKEGQRLNNDLVQTNQQYNLTYFAVDPSVRANYTYAQFNTHPFFDVYAFGVLLSEFMDEELARFQVGAYVWKSLHYLADLCREQNPADRPDPLYLQVFFKQFIKLLQTDCQ